MNVVIFFQPHCLRNYAQYRSEEIWTDWTSFNSLCLNVKFVVESFVDIDDFDMLANGKYWIFLLGAESDSKYDYIMDSIEELCGEQTVMACVPM